MPLSHRLRSVIGANALFAFTVAPFFVSFCSSAAFAQLTAPTALPPPAKSAPTVTSTFPSAAFSRALRNKDGSVQSVQTAIRRFDFAPGSRASKAAAHPTVYLVAVLHIGEKDYYNHLQSFLDKQDVVLYEGVGAEASNPTPATSKKRSAGNQAKADGANGANGGDGEDSENDGTRQLATLLNLQSQADDINYDKPNFRHSDMSMEAINAWAAKAGPDAVNSVNALNNTVDGKFAEGGAMGKAVEDLLTQGKADKDFALRLRRVIVELFADPEAAKKMQNPEMAKLDPLVVVERNKVVLADLKTLMQTASVKGENSPRSVAIFYGEGHMQDLARHLVADMGYRPGTTQWLTAMKASP